MLRRKISHSHQGTGMGSFPSLHLELDRVVREAPRLAPLVGGTPQEMARELMRARALEMAISEAQEEETVRTVS